MTLARLRSLFMSLVGMRYRELPFSIRRHDVDAVLIALRAEKIAQSGTPAFEVSNDYFRIGRRKLRLCTEDQMFVSLWGPKTLVDQVYARVIEHSEARRQPRV
jgi:hypothetical protein